MSNIRLDVTRTPGSPDEGDEGAAVEQTIPPRTRTRTTVAAILIAPALLSKTLLTKRGLARVEITPSGPEHDSNLVRIEDPRLTVCQNDGLAVGHRSSQAHPVEELMLAGVNHRREVEVAPLRVAASSQFLQPSAV